jgi:hypothetical protein
VYSYRTIFEWLIKRPAARPVSVSPSFLLLRSRNIDNFTKAAEQPIDIDENVY